MSAIAELRHLANCPSLSDPNFACVCGAGSTRPEAQARAFAEGNNPNDFWVVSAFRFKEHTSLSSAEEERDRLIKSIPDKKFRVLHCKRRLSASNSGLVIGKMSRALQRLLADYDEESGRIAAEPDPGCIECTDGATPDHLNTGLCGRHQAIDALKEAGLI